MVSIELLRSSVGYDPNIGSFVWRSRPREHFRTYAAWQTWNSRFSGEPALQTQRPDGYLSGRVGYTNLLAHRAAWAIVTGSWPEEEVDHINGVRNDNRWCNLRAATRIENGRNLKRKINNTSGVCGVSRCKKTRHWVARIRIKGRVKSLGAFVDFEDAKRARKAAEIAEGFHPNHGR